MNNYTEHFQSYRHDVSDKARQYASGLMQAGPRKNMDRMAEVVPESKSRNLQQFLTHSKWDHREVVDHVAKDADELLGDPKNACLLIDETGFEKQGNASVGVSRQWLGRFGKVDNGQVAVFGALAKGRFTVPVDVRLYMPRKWTNDRQRCDKAGVPVGARQFRTKPELGLEIVRHSRENKLRFGWVGADAGYSNSLGFCLGLDEMGETFVVDLHSDFRVYLQDPKPYLPERRKKAGRPFEKYQTNSESTEVRDIAESLSPQRWRTVTLRDTTRGALRVRICRLKVYVWVRQTQTVRCMTLIISKSLGSNPDTKISLANTPWHVTLRRLGSMQHHRYWVERAFEEAKSECGMADYQVRKWSAWHHHMALVMMALMFMLSEKIRHEDTCPLLSCSDIEELLAHFLPRRDVTAEEVLSQLDERHAQRRRAAASHARRQKRLLAAKQGKD